MPQSDSLRGRGISGNAEDIQKFQNAQRVFLGGGPPIDEELIAKVSRRELPPPATPVPVPQVGIDDGEKYGRRNRR